MPTSPDADDLLVVLAVARLGRFTAAADLLGVNHTTVSRRVAAVEKAIGERVLVQTPGGWELTETGRRVITAAEAVEAAVASLLVGQDGRERLTGVVRVASPDGYAVAFLVPGAVRLQQRHPGIDIELTTATQRARHHRTGVDIDIVVGEPDVRRASRTHLLDYRLRCYATRSYLAKAGVPQSVSDLAGHPLIYYVESALTVDELDVATAALPRPARCFASTSVFAHVEATLAGGGVGLLPDYLAERHDSLVRVVPDFEHGVGYWAVVREQSLRNPAVRALLAELVRSH